ncbi:MULTISPECIES: hypothetical protein [unclassified Crossiella]|uniref:hypothetical protein n=1 Tax=unclassified Crossiella TaxID=2620835 RepID=UPI001FFEFFF3|nr:MULTISPECIES: hypothetical protein [unclassified Crossiella]MCK2243985.1 hypothetical protein [Crossiella sp. S99.2]MCK2257157.1 hypothetical protein [Crossiella sp. S99.1]
MPLPLLLIAAGATAGGLTAAGFLTSDTPRPEGHAGDRIYKWFHDEAKTPSAGLVPIERIWTKAAGDYGLIRDQIEKVITASHGVWQGAAAEAARRQLSPLAGYAEAAGGLAKRTAEAVAQQTADWYGCKNQLKPVPADPPQNNLLNKVTPFSTDLDREIERFRADTGDNQRVLAGYGVRKEDNVTRLPSWTAPQAADGDVSVVEPGGGGGVDGRDRGRDGGRGTGRGTGGGQPGGGYGGPGTGTGGGGGTGGGTGGGDPVEVPGGQVTGPPNRDDTGLAGWAELPPGTAADGVGGGHSLGVGGSAGGPGGGLSGATGFGPGGAGVGRGVGFGPGGSAGVGRSGGGTSTAGGGVRPGAPGMSGLPVGGAGAGRREEDEEHERPSYLLETEDVFGDTRYAAPPVIGEEAGT